MPSRPRRSEKLELRITPKAQPALQAAAPVSHQSVSDFVLESALARADEALADRCSFSLSATSGRYSWPPSMLLLDLCPGLSAFSRNRDFSISGLVSDREGPRRKPPLRIGLFRSTKRKTLRYY
jgi:hypothetical protein